MKKWVNTFNVLAVISNEYSISIWKPGPATEPYDTRLSKYSSKSLSSSDVVITCSSAKITNVSNPNFLNAFTYLSFNILILLSDKPPINSSVKTWSAHPKVQKSNSLLVVNIWVLSLSV